MGKWVTVCVRRAECVCVWRVCVFLRVDLYIVCMPLRIMSAIYIYVCVCFHLCFPSYGNVSMSSTERTHLCIFFMNLSLSFSLPFSASHSSPLCCLILLSTCSVKLLCAPIIGNLYVYRYGLFWRLSAHALQTFKSSILLFRVPHLSLLLSATVAGKEIKEKQTKMKKAAAFVHSGN